MEEKKKGVVPKWKEDKRSAVVLRSAGLRSGDVYRETGGLVNYSTAKRWLGGDVSWAGVWILEVLCDRILGEEDNEGLKKSKESGGSKKEVMSKDVIIACETAGRGYGAGSRKESGDFWFFEYNGSCWKVGSGVGLSEDIMCGGDIVSLGDFKVL